MAPRSTAWNSSILIGVALCLLAPGPATGQLNQQRGRSGDSSTPSPTGSVSTAKATTAPASRPEFPWPYGRVTGPIECQADTQWSYYLYLPNSLPAGELWPVMFVMSPSGGTASTLDRYLPGAEFVGMVLVCSVQARNDFAPGREAIEAMVKDAIKRLPLDPAMFYASGYSGGARRATTLAAGQCTKPFTGVLHCAGAAGAGTLAQKTLKYGLCGSNCFNRWDMARFYERNSPFRSHLRFFIGNHDWAPVDLITDGMIWLYGNTLRRQASLPKTLPQRDRFVVKLTERIKASQETQPADAYYWATFLTAFPASPKLLTESQTIARQLQANPTVVTFLAGEADVEKYWQKHFAESGKSGTRDAERMATKYAGTPYEALFKRLGQDSPQ